MLTQLYRHQFLLVLFQITLTSETDPDKTLYIVSILNKPLETNTVFKVASYTRVIYKSNIDKVFRIERNNSYSSKEYNIVYRIHYIRIARQCECGCGYNNLR